MKKYLLLATFFILGTVKYYAQKIELGEVSIAELNEKVHPKDTSAVAAILFEKGNTHFDYTQEYGFKVVTDVEVKIKIYKKEGYDYANKSVSFYVGGDTDESVSFSKAVTYNLVNGKIEKTKLKSEGEFIEKANKFWNRKKITMPSVKVGSIIEYKYTITSPYTSTFPEWNFQNEIPVNHSEYETYIPEYYFYNVYRKGSLKPVEIKNTLNKSIQLSYKELVDRGRIVKYERSNETINYTENKIVYKLENIPALKEESFVNNIDNYRTTIQHELSGRQMPQGMFESFSTTWEDVAKKIYENEDFGNQLDKNNYYEEDLKTILQGVETREEKVATILKFVQSKMTWNKYNSYLCDVGVKKAYQDKIGNSAEINLMLVSMLRYAGFNANPVLVSTRSNGISLFPSRTAFNFVIAEIIFDNDRVLLDATSKISSPNILPLYDLNWFGRSIRKSGTSENIDLMPKMISNDVINMLATIDAQGQVNGKVREQYFDYNALRFRDKYSELSQDSYLDNLEKRHKGLEITDYEIVNKNEINEPIIEKYSFKSDNLTETIGDKIYIEPLLYLSENENPFKQETREYPIDFSFPFKDKYMITITIPEGYQVESIPKSVSLIMDGGYGSFSMSASNTDNNIQITVNLSVNESIVPAQDYDILKEFFKVSIEKQNEKIVLKKI
jgi:hypothetical protein